MSLSRLSRLLLYSTAAFSALYYTKPLKQSFSAYLRHWAQSLMEHRQHGDGAAGANMMEKLGSWLSDSLNSFEAASWATVALMQAEYADARVAWVVAVPSPASGGTSLIFVGAGGIWFFVVELGW